LLVTEVNGHTSSPGLDVDTVRTAPPQYVSSHIGCTVRDRGGRVAAGRVTGLPPAGAPALGIESWLCRTSEPYGCSRSLVPLEPPPEFQVADSGTVSCELAALGRVSRV